MSFSNSVRIDSCLYLLLLFPQIGLPVAEEELGNHYSPPNIYRFANHLFEEQDYWRAADEYQRYLRQELGNVGTDSIMFKIGLCYYYAYYFAEAAKTYRELIDLYPESNLIDKSHILVALILLKMGDDNALTVYIEQINTEHMTPRARSEIMFLGGLGYLYTYRWSDAEKNFRELSSHESCPQDLQKLSRRLEKIALQGESLKKKSPIFAGFLSALVPGLGRVYLNRQGGGVFSLLMVGVMGYSAYVSFAARGVASVNGWIFAISAVPLYLGNIYGSAVGADVYNMKQREELLDQVQFSIDDLIQF